MSSFSIAVNAVVPIFLMIILGYFVKKTGIVSDTFASQATKFVFRVSLPAMVFSKVAAIDVRNGIDISQMYLMLFCGLGTLVAYLLSKGFSYTFINKKKTVGTRTGFVHGAFIQGAFRSNYLIIGYPILLNLYGDEIVVKMALVTLVVIPCYNVLSIIALTPPNEHAISKRYKDLIGSILKNPLIIGILLGFASAFLKISYAPFINNFISMNAGLSTPLALVAIGAFFHFDGFKESLKDALLATGIKIVILPILATVIAYILGFSSQDIMLICVLFGGPAAVSSFAMSAEMGGDSVLSGNIVILSSGLCLVSYIAIMTVWLSILL